MEEMKQEKIEINEEIKKNEGTTKRKKRRKKNERNK